MENKEDLYNQEELELLNELGTISKNFQNIYNELEESSEEQEK